MSEETLAPRYEAAPVEPKWFKLWEESGAFEPDPNAAGPAFCITIPPPNITGSLHMGHALCYSLQDMLGRFYRMKGHKVLILPGQDHAGIATQSVVAKKLKAEGRNPQEIGREAFIERTWEWREESGDEILRQFRALGCSFDWSRTRFTLDDEYVKAVLKVFIEWFNRGLIYRGLRVVNWDPVLQTSVSDIETERKDINGKLYHVRYPFADGSGEVIIATTRPETMLADVAVAVHPSDTRYEGKVGKKLILPLMNREIPLIADQYPDPEFGTGAVKITPGHDPNDYEVGQRHGLEVLIAMDGKARINKLGGKYQGLERYAARKAVLSDLEEGGYLVKVDDHSIPMIYSSRSGEAIEPLASEQWFVNQRALAEDAIKVVEAGKIKFIPERFTDIYLDWLKNIRDWNISRQLWWGHRIPVYYTESGEAFASLNWEEAQAQAGDQKIIRQDDDVLDTWFSSGLWPFATLGWPNETDDLKTFYPTSVLVTARDILYLWVARMVMMGMDFMKEIPFGEVMIYATIFTEKGERMSKSLGTGIDPIPIIETKGADALRWSLLSQTGSNQDIRYGEKKSDESRAFCNKIWNASRFVLMNIENWSEQAPDQLADVDLWLLSRLNQTVESVTAGYESRDIQSTCQDLYRFFWNDVCDWYIEISKPRLNDPAQKRIPQWVLVRALRTFCQLAHPVMPFITEELASHLPGYDGTILVKTQWPTVDSNQMDEVVSNRVQGWFEGVRAVRALRAETGANPMKTLPEIWFEGDLAGGEEILKSQAWFQDVKQGRPEGSFLSTTSGDLNFHLPIDGLVDVAKEKEKAEKDLAKKQTERDKLAGRLGNADFISRAKPEVVERDRQALADLDQEIARLLERLQMYAG
jgi:valyl-tRNA synthetase